MCLDNNKTKKQLEIELNILRTKCNNLEEKLEGNIKMFQKKEETLKEKESKLRNLFNMMQDVVFEMDYNGTYLNIAPTESNKMVRPAEESEGKSLYDFFTKKEADLFLGFIRQCIDENRPNKIIYPINFEDKEVWFEGRANPIQNKRVLFIASDITLRKQEEKKLIESERRFKNLAENIPGAIYLCNNDKTYSNIYINDLIEELTGYPKEDFLNGKISFTDLFHKEDAPKIFEVIDNAINEKTKFHIEYRLKHKLGHYIWVEEFGSGVFGNNKLLFLEGILFDISEKKKISEELKKLHIAIQQSPSVVVMTDKNGIIEYVNPKCAELTGYKPEELLGQTIDIFRSNQQSKERINDLWKIISSGKVWKGEFSNKKKNGEVFWERAIISPVVNTNGDIINYIKISEDITEKRNYEQLQTIIHNISNAVTVRMNINDFILFVKKQLETIIDTTNFYLAQYNEPLDVFELLYNEDSVEKIKQISRKKSFTAYVAETKKTLYIKKAEAQKLIDSGEMELIGQLAEVWIGVPLLSKDKLVGVMILQSYDNENAFLESDVKYLEIISHQISLSLDRLQVDEDLHKALEKAKQSDRLKSAFLSNMSHEIRTPMNGILGFTDLLKNTKLTGKEKDKYISIIERSGNRMLNTINDIVDISRIEAGHVEVFNTEFSINKLLKEQYDFFSKEAVKKGLKLNYTSLLSEENSNITSDHHKVESVLTNLIKNAIKYTNSGSINFGVTMENNRGECFYNFYVVDTGIGIPKDRFKAVFNRFEQADIKDTRVYEGSGLGLAISKSYVEMLGGKIKLISEVEVGSTFSFTIPCFVALPKQ